MSSANTFGTFLETTNSLASKRSDAAASIDLGLVANAISTETLSLGSLAEKLAVSKSTLMTTLLEGKQSGILDIETGAGEPNVHLTELGRGFLD